jgi:hypothetical protein
MQRGLGIEFADFCDDHHSHRASMLSDAVTLQQGLDEPGADSRRVRMQPRQQLRDDEGMQLARMIRQTIGLEEEGFDEPAHRIDLAELDTALNRTNNSCHDTLSIPQQQICEEPKITCGAASIISAMSRNQVRMYCTHEKHRDSEIRKTTTLATL